jgi:hypothetical protein
VRIAKNIFSDLPPPVEQLPKKEPNFLTGRYLPFARVLLKGILYAGLASPEIPLHKIKKFYFGITESKVT